MEWLVALFGVLMRLEEEHHTEHGSATNGEVEVEAVGVSDVPLGLSALITYHHRHVTYSVKRPPSRGPTMAPTPNITPTDALYTGLF